MSKVEESVEAEETDHLADALTNLFTNISSMLNGDLQETSNVVCLLEKMNMRVAEEYKSYGDVASGLRVFVEQLKSKSRGFDDYVLQIHSIEQQLTEFEAVVSLLDNYVSLFESKLKSLHHHHP